ncbi:MAG: hypothetical protein ABR968_12805, partial [Bacteroidales bacterium]
MKITFTVLMLLVFQVGIMQAQMVGTNAYMNGAGVEIGINGAGGFEGVDTTVSPVPAGMHCRTNTVFFGIVANPQNNNWATFDGDFFTPGTPENGWGITIGANISSAGDNCDYLDQIPGSITNYQHISNYYIVDWEGTKDSIDVKIEYFLKQTDLFYNTSVSIKNNKTRTIPSLYYYRNIDPDNNIMINGGSYVTVNKIVSQPDPITGYGIAMVTATQRIPWKSYCGFAASGANWRASYGGFSNRSGYDMWTPSSTFTQTVGSSDSADIAIQLSYRMQNLTPGATSTFNFNTFFSDSAGQAYGNLMYFMFPASSNAPMVACSTCADTVSTCGGPVPIVIAGATVDHYSWVWSPAAGLSTNAGDSVIANPSVTTLYTVFGTPLDTTVTADTLTIVVKLTPGAIVSITASANPACSGALTTLTGSGA